MATTYYVTKAGSDANAGTVGAPFLTIAKGKSVAAAGDTILVGDGNWQGSIYSAGDANGTSGNPITLKSLNHLGAKIKALSATGAGSGNNAAVEIRADWWIVDGFEVDGSGGYTSETWTIGGTEWYIGVYLTGSHSIARNCKIHDLAKSAGATPLGGAGAEGDYYYGGSTHSFENNEIYNIGAAAGNNTVHAIYVASANTKATGNLCYQCASTGVTSWHAATGLEAANNTIFACRQGITVGAGDAPGGVTHSNARIYNNNVTHCSVTGIDEEGSTGTNNLYVNNLSWNNGTNWALLTGTQSGSINADPQFVNYVATGGGDYTLKATSPAISAGVSGIATAPAVTAPTVDINGNVRPLGVAIDLGAYEYVSMLSTGATVATRQSNRVAVTTGIAYHFASATGQGQTGAAVASGANTVGVTRQTQSVVVAGFAAVTSFLSVATKQGQSASVVSASTYKVDTHAATYQGQSVSVSAATQIVITATAITAQGQTTKAVSISSGTSFAASYQGQSANIAAVSTLVSSLTASTQQGQTVLGVTFGSKTADMFSATYQGQTAHGTGTPAGAAHVISTQTQTAHASLNGAAGTYIITRQGQGSTGTLSAGASTVKHRGKWRVSVTK